MENGFLDWLLMIEYIYLYCSWFHWMCYALKATTSTRTTTYRHICSVICGANRGPICTTTHDHLRRPRLLMSLRCWKSATLRPGRCSKCPMSFMAVLVSSRTRWAIRATQLFRSRPIALYSVMRPPGTFTMAKTIALKCAQISIKRI